MEQYIRAFREIESGITSNQRELLRAHFLASAHTTTAQALAAEVGYPSYATVNAQYGRLASRMARALGVPATPKLDVLTLWRRMPQADLQLTLRPEVVGALRALSWFESAPAILVGKASTSSAVEVPVARRERSARVALASLAETVREWLRSHAAGVPWRQPRETKAAVGHDGCLYASVAQLSEGGGTLVLFHDNTVGRPNKHLYFGFHATGRARIEQIESAARPTYGEPIPENDDRRLEPEEFGVPFLEEVAADEHYYGIYLADTEAALGARDAEIAPRVGGFFVDIALALNQEKEENGATPRQLGLAPVRPQQGKFRGDLLALFQATCCMTGCQIVSALEAAHIRTRPGADENELGNGLLLRADVHRLFDVGLIAIDPRNLTIWVHKSLETTEYWNLGGCELQASARARRVLLPNALRERWSKRQT